MHPNTTQRPSFCVHVFEHLHGFTNVNSLVVVIVHALFVEIVRAFLGGIVDASSNSSFT